MMMKDDLCQKWRVKLIFEGTYRLPGTGIVEHLKIIDIRCNLKQFDVQAGRRCIFHFRPKTTVTCAYIIELSYGSVANATFSAQRKWHFWNENEKKTKKKIHFQPKTKKSRKWPNSPFSAPKTKTNFGRLLVWWLDLTDPDPLRFYERSTFYTTVLRRLLWIVLYSTKMETHFWRI